MKHAENLLKFDVIWWWYGGLVDALLLKKRNVNQNVKCEMSSVNYDSWRVMEYIYESQLKG